MSADLFEWSGIEAKEARDAALQQVSEGSIDWISAALSLIKDYPAFGVVTGEALRLWLVSQIGEPHHHNVTGAMIRMAISRRLITPTGRYENMKTKRSHARRTPTYFVNR